MALKSTIFKVDLAVSDMDRNLYERSCDVRWWATDAAVVDAIASSDYPTPARRPAWSVLDNRRLQQDFGIVLPAWQDGLKRVMAEIAAA